MNTIPAALLQHKFSDTQTPRRDEIVIGAALGLTSSGFLSLIDHSATIAVAALLSAYLIHLQLCAAGTAQRSGDIILYAGCCALVGLLTCWLGVSTVKNGNRLAFGAFALIMQLPLLLSLVPCGSVHARRISVGHAPPAPSLIEIASVAVGVLSVLLAGWSISSLLILDRFQPWEIIAPSASGNLLSCQLNMLLPLQVAFAIRTRDLARVAWAILAGISILTIVCVLSRVGIVSLAATLLLACLYLPGRVRLMLGGFVALAAVGILLSPRADIAWAILKHFGW